MDLLTAYMGVVSLDRSSQHTYCTPDYYPGKPVRKAKYYVITFGRVTGIFRNWLLTESLITGFSGSAHQSYLAPDDALNSWRENCLLNHANGDHHPELKQLARDQGTIPPLPESVSLESLREEAIRRHLRPATPPTYHSKTFTTPRSPTKPLAPAYTRSPSPTPAPRTPLKGSLREHGMDSKPAPSPAQRAFAATSPPHKSAPSPSSVSSTSSGASITSSSSRPQSLSNNAPRSPNRSSSSPEPTVSSSPEPIRTRPPRNVYGVSFGTFRNAIFNSRVEAGSLYSVFREAHGNPGFYVGTFDEVVADMTENWRDIFFSFVGAEGHVRTYNNIDVARTRFNHSSLYSDTVEMLLDETVLGSARHEVHNCEDHDWVNCPETIS